MILYGIPSNMNVLTVVETKNMTRLKMMESVYISNSAGNLGSIFYSILAAFWINSSRKSKWFTNLTITTCFSSIILTTLVAYTTTYEIQKPQVWISVMCILVSIMSALVGIMNGIVGDVFVFLNIVHVNIAIVCNHIGGLIVVILWAISKDYMIYYSLILLIWLIPMCFVTIALFGLRKNLVATKNTVTLNSAAEDFSTDTMLIIAFFLNSVNKGFEFPLYFISHEAIMSQITSSVLLDVLTFHMSNLVGSMVYTVTKTKQSSGSILSLVLVRIFFVCVFTTFNSWRVCGSDYKKIIHIISTSALWITCGWLNNCMVSTFKTRPVTFVNVYMYGLYALGIVTGLQFSMTLEYFRG
jgi:hypothetical protein